MSDRGAVLRLASATYEEIAALDKARAVVMLPVGATEAHGPHLPLETDVIISDAMAERGAERLAERGVSTVLAPPLAYSAAEYAAAFAGTISLRPETATALIVDVGRALLGHGFRVLALVNGHLDPAHIGSLYAAKKELEGAGLTVVFPDVTRKPWALRLTAEFKSGACHAGQYEGSIVMYRRPELVREQIRKGLPDNPNSLSVAIREGRSTFEAAGGPRAYFGSPASASAEEGRQTVDVLGEVLEQAVLETTGWS